MMKRIVEFPRSKNIVLSHSQEWDWSNLDGIRASKDKQRYYIIPNDAKLEGL